MREWLAALLATTSRGAGLGLAAGQPRRADDWWAAGRG